MNLTAVSVRRTLLGMRGYSQFCPVALACEVLAERWTPLIVRELLAGSHRFSELQRGLPRIPRALLVQRLGSLERAGLVERRPGRTGRGWEYHLSVAGEELRPVVESLGRWGWRWAAWELRPDNLDSKLLMWFVRRRIRVDRLPPERVTVRFEFRGTDGAPPERLWLVLHRPEVDLCLSDPGFEVDLDVTTDVRAFTQVYLGYVRVADAVRGGSLTVAGRSELRRAFGGWIGVSQFATRAGATAPGSPVSATR
ncbi:MAG TPA: helix-turn-helix domain-containing protein [Actinomycetes bacterium]|nr:helix-turn-helix domain-containing protein [Actinomycetes bacterium]